MFVAVPARGRSIRAGLVPALSLLALMGIGAYAVMGPTGMLAWSEYRQKLDERQAELAKAKAEEAALENRLKLLEPGKVDPDLASELARRELNVAHPDDIIIPLD